ncbi:MAG: immune inhibitor A [SAR202 cluster bacterium]|nr:immune inhibitor A [SAR202 cluster bacterium]
MPGSSDISRTVDGVYTELKPGRTDTFWLVDLADTVAYESTFELALVTPHAYWYVEDGLTIDLADLQRSATQFEEETYPAVTQVFGNEWNPGVDNDPHLNVLNAKLSGVAGYFSSTDEYPTAVRPRSNQREIIYMNAVNVPPGGANYDEVIAHELQHAIHWNADDSEDTWINEGLAELSTSIVFDSQSSTRQFLRAGPTSLIHWPIAPVGGIASYGASSLFLHFLTEHYGGRSDLKNLMSQPNDGINGINGYLESLGYESRFEDVFREWAAANILDGDGIFGYDDLDVSVAVSKRIAGFDEFESEIPQYAVEYTELESISGPFTLSFKGPTTGRLLPVDVGSTGCWWSNSGDSIDSTLTRRVGLPAGTTGTLDYEVWFEIEEAWDYAYVEASIDGGSTWRIIETPASSPENPIGASFGPGYTGSSNRPGNNGWIKESVDLSSYAGTNLQVRLQYVTDDAISASGACFRGLSISTLARNKLDRTSGLIDNPDGIYDWQANGFVFTDNVVRQDFQVQLITVGKEPLVRQVPLDATNSGKLTITPPVNGERLIVAVGTLAEKTRQPTSYSLRVGSPE